MSENNICEDYPMQDKPNPIVEACEANNVMPEQVNHFDLMQIDQIPTMKAMGALLQFFHSILLGLPWLQGILKQQKDVSAKN